VSWRPWGWPPQDRLSGDFLKETLRVTQGDKKLVIHFTKYNPCGAGRTGFRPVVRRQDFIDSSCLKFPRPTATNVPRYFLTI